MKIVFVVRITRSHFYNCLLVLRKTGFVVFNSHSVVFCSVSFEKDSFHSF